MKIFIDPGHGGVDVGGRRYKEQGLYEKDVNLDIALKVKCILTERGHEVMMSRNEDVQVSLVERVKMANNWFANYFISVHANSVGYPSANGVETLYYPGSIKGQAIAAEIQEQLIMQTNLVNRGIKAQDVYVLRKTRMPAAMAECGFISNPLENELLNKEEFRSKCARAIADGITQYINMTT